MSIPDTDPGSVLPLVRWLGAEAEILEPAQPARKAPDRARCDPACLWMSEASWRMRVSRTGWRGCACRAAFVASLCWLGGIAHCRYELPRGRELRRLARGAAAGGGRAGDVATERSPRSTGSTFDERVLKQDRGQPTPVAELSGFRRPRRLRRPPRARPRAAEEACRDLRADRARLRRAGPGHRRLLGAGDRLRRLHGRLFLAPLAGDARLRLPPAGAFSRRADRRAAADRERRPRCRRK